MLLAFTAAMGSDVLAQTNVGGLICGNTTWTTANSPYVVTSSVVIGCGATLTIQPGVEVRFNSGLGITVGSQAFGAGTLKAQGTSGSKILFRSNIQPQNPGAWARIYFTDFAIDADFDGSGNYLTGSIIEHAIIEYAGAGSVAAVTIEQSRPYLSRCEIRHNSNRGIFVDGSGASTPPQRIDDCEVWDCLSGGGVYLANGSGHRLARNNVHNCSGIGVQIISARAMLEENTVANNTSDGVQFHSFTGQTLTSNRIMNNAGQGMSFYSAGGNTLTSNTVTGNGAHGFYFTSSGGNTLTLNTVTGNGARAANFEYSGSTTLTSNTIAGNNGGGIQFFAK
jgi:parallel beta-helix repeat protein